MGEVRAITMPPPGSSVSYDTSKGVFKPTRALMMKRKPVDDLLKEHVVEHLLVEALRGAAEVNAQMQERGLARGVVCG